MPQKSETQTKRKPGRPPKKDDILSEQATSLQMSEKSDKKITLTDVKNSLTSLFANEIGNVYGGLDFNIFNPFLQNTRLKMISSYPASYDPEIINNALQQPQFNEPLLRSASWSLSASQYLYYLILREAADIPLLKYWVQPPVLDKKDYSSPKFEKEEEFVNDWLTTFDVYNTLKRVLLETKREGKSTYVFRQCIEEVGGKKKPRYVTWQKLPTEFTKLTAIGEHGYIASFNLLVFLNPAFSPAQYPEYIQEIWKELLNKGAIYEDAQRKSYALDYNKLRNFSYGPMNTRGIIEMSNNSYMYWVQLPQELCFTFASDSSHAWVAPDTMGLFSALQELTDYSVLAGLVNSTPLTSVLTGEAEFIGDADSGQDQTCISPHTLVAMQNQFNRMASSNIQAFFAPLKNLKLQSLPDVPNASNIKTQAVQNFISVAGEGGLIAATDKPSVAMIKGAQMAAAARCDFVVQQCAAILNMLLKRWTGVQYDWKIHLWGDIYSFDSQVGRIKELVAGGASFLLPKLASAYDMSMRDVRAMNNYMDAFDVYAGFKTLAGKKNSSSSSDNNEDDGETRPVGRPALDETDIENENTAASRDAGTNVSDIKEFAQEGRCIICGEITEDGHPLCYECEEKLEVFDNE